MTNGFGWWGTDTWWGDQNGDFWSHGGFMNGVRTQLNYYPEDSSGLIVLTNGEGNYTAIQNEIEEYIPLFETGMTTGIDEKGNSNLKVFPNPVSVKEKLHVQFSECKINVKGVKMYDLKGRLIWAWKKN